MMTLKKQSMPSPRPATNPQSPSKRNDGGGAPGPKFTIPCPPKPKK